MVPRPTLPFRLLLQLIKRAQTRKKWSEYASERINFSKFSYLGEGHTSLPLSLSLRNFGPLGLVALDTTTFKISPPPFEILCPRLHRGERIVEGQSESEKGQAVLISILFNYRRYDLHKPYRCFLFIVIKHRWIRILHPFVVTFFEFIS